MAHLTDLASEVDRGRLTGLGPFMCLVCPPGDALGDRVDSLMNVRLALASSSPASISARVSAISCFSRRISLSWRCLFSSASRIACCSASLCCRRLSACSMALSISASIGCLRESKLASDSSDESALLLLRYESCISEGVSNLGYSVERLSGVVLESPGGCVRSLDVEASPT